MSKGEGATETRDKLSPWNIPLVIFISPKLWPQGVNSTFHTLYYQLFQKSQGIFISNCVVSYRRLFDSQLIAIAKFHVLLPTNMELYIFHILDLHSSCRFLLNFLQLPILPYCSSLLTYSLLPTWKHSSLTPFSVHPLPITSFWHTILLYGLLL